MTTPFLKTPELVLAQADRELFVNAAIRHNEAAISIEVLDKDLATPPLLPADTARYIVAAGATSVWAGQTGKVAYRVDNAWRFVEPRIGWIVFVVDETARYTWTGSAWDLFQSGAPLADEVVVIPSTHLDQTNVQAALNLLLTMLDQAIGLSGSEGCPPGPNLYTEILADSPTGYWRCDETSGTNLNDSSGNSNTLALAGTYILVKSALVPSEPGKKYIWLDGAAGTGGSVAGSMGLTTPLTGDWTVTGIAAILDDTQAHFFFGILGAGETEAANAQVIAGVSTAEFSRIFWEFSTGTDSDIATTVAPVTEGKPYHFAMVKDGTADTVDFYLNGVWLSQSSYANEPSGGSSVTTYVGTSGGTGFEGILGEVAFFNGQKLSATRIAAHARAAGLLGR